MWQSALKTAAATFGFALLHSSLASLGAKRRARRLIGEENADGLYRAFFVGQSALTSALLVAYMRRLPNRELYNVRGPVRCALRAGQLSGALMATAAAYEVGISRISGLQSLRAWLDNQPAPTPAVAQGPVMDDLGMRARGPFRITRHPLNSTPLLILWLSPRMTVNLLAFNLVATAYLIVGSLHEEQRLLAAYGPAYEAYRKSGVPFFFPAVRLEPARRSLGSSQAAGPGESRSTE